mmetsp:Transcript_2917/g.11945  ORF Transcript_2917/g.11945 Transcript_2917/m.11945 type:complete len:215 (+) Transcript_2917:1459-2103(+)
MGSRTCEGHGVWARSSAAAAAAVRGAKNPPAPPPPVGLDDVSPASSPSSSWPSWDSSPTTGNVGQNSRRARKTCVSIRLSASVCASSTYAPVTSSRPPLSLSPRSPEFSTPRMMPSPSAVRSSRSATRCGTLTLATFGPVVSTCPTPYPRMSSEKDTDARVTTEVAGLLAQCLVRDRCGTAARNDGPWARVWTRGTNAGADASERRARAVTVWR